MSTVPDLTPLMLNRQRNHLEFALRDQTEIMPQLPEDYEQYLAERLAGILQEDAPLTAEMNLHGISAISSRQLGSLIALGKVLRSRFGKIAVTGVSPGVRHLLEMTRTDQLFELR